MHRERTGVGVELVHQCLREHVGRGERELQRVRGQALHGLPRGGEVQAAFANRPAHDARRLRAELHALRGAELGQLLARERRVDAGHRADEVVNHPVGLRVVHVEARQLAVRDDIKAGEFLRLEHDEDGVAQRGGGGKRGEPRGDGIAADDGGQNLRGGHAGSVEFNAQSSRFKVGTSVIGRYSSRMM